MGRVVDNVRPSVTEGVASARLRRISANFVINPA